MAYLEQLSDTDDEREILEASRQHVRQARIAAAYCEQEIQARISSRPLQSQTCVSSYHSKCSLHPVSALQKEMDDEEDLLILCGGEINNGGRWHDDWWRRFQCVKSRRCFRNRLRRLNCVATDMATWESALRSENPNIRCPWLISVFFKRL